ncbi:2300_t:CDS:2 [Scutellospora calospora]|uniref:2300_t:CDS:1 n=1 Tax=Scutellospora calospora TaxID=85575 RepID=A0ACA9LIQ9_9GLOM|nr:2300_t:CDS:2 [Scutellospora calospora]
MSTLQNALLKEFEDEDINDDFIDKQIDINTSLFNNKEELNEDAEQFKSPVVTMDLVKNEATLDLSESFISTVFTAVQKNLIYNNEIN